MYCYALPFRPRTQGAAIKPTKKPFARPSIGILLLCSATFACFSTSNADTFRPVERGKEIKLELVKGLSSRTVRARDNIKLRVAQDVTDKYGNVLIAKGTTAGAVVTNVRRAELLNLIFFKKPVLEIGSPYTLAVDGTRIPLCFAFAAESESQIEERKLFRSTPTEILLASKHPGVVHLETALKDPSRRKVAEEVIEILASSSKASKKVEDLKEPQRLGFIAGVAGAFGLPKVEDLLSDRNVTLISKMAKNAPKTTDLASANNSKLTPLEIAALSWAVLEASTELFNKVAAWVDRQNIDVVEGTSLQAFVNLPTEEPTLLIKSPSYDLSKDAIRLKVDDIANVWDYGYFQESHVPDPTNFTPYPRRYPLGTTFTASEMTSNIPNMVMNRGESSIELPGSLTTTIEPRQTILQPAPGLVPGNVFYSVVRWTAPVDGSFDIDATFTGADTTPTSSDVYVLINGSTQFEDQVNTYGPTGTKLFKGKGLELQKGQVVDFVVGPGSNDARNDATTVTAKITRVFK